MGYSVASTATQGHPATLNLNFYTTEEIPYPTPKIPPEITMLLLNLAVNHTPLPVNDSGPTAAVLEAWLSTCLQLSPSPDTDLIQLLTFLQHPSLSVSNLSLRTHAGLAHLEVPPRNERLKPIGFHLHPVRSQPYTLFDEKDPFTVDNTSLTQQLDTLKLQNGQHYIALKAQGKTPQWYSLENIASLDIIQQRAENIVAPPIITPLLTLSPLYPRNTVPVLLEDSLPRLNTAYTAPLKSFLPAEKLANYPCATGDLSLQLGLAHFNSASDDSEHKEYCFHCNFILPTTAASPFTLSRTISIEAPSQLAILAEITVQFQESLEYFLQCHSEWSQLHQLSQQHNATFALVEHYRSRWHTSLNNGFAVQWKSNPDPSNPLPLFCDTVNLSLSSPTTFAHVLAAIHQKELDHQLLVITC